MSAPIQLDGPYINRRSQRRMRLAAVVVSGLLCAMPFVASAIAAYAAP